KFK
ncbi:hypothetical protein ACTFIW_002270, partial [Dictyostelium discoideum]